MNMESIIALLKKIKALADHGVNGEREAAQAKLKALMARHKLSAELLVASADRQQWPFNYKTADELEVLCHCYHAVRPGEGERVKFQKNSKAKLAWFWLNNLELADLTIMWQHYRRDFRAQRRKFYTQFKDAYIQKQDLAIAGGEQQDMTPEELDDLMAVLALAHDITRKPWLKARALVTKG